MVSIQGQESDSVFVQPLTAKRAPLPVSGLLNQAELRGVAWDIHGNLIVTTATSILRLSRDGSRQATLLSDPSQYIQWSSVCGRGGPVLFSTAGREEDRDDYLARGCGWISSKAADERQAGFLAALLSGRSSPFYHHDFATSRIMKMPIDGGSLRNYKRRDARENLCSSTTSSR